MRLDKRLDQLEAKVIPAKPTRYFTGYEATGRYYEANSAPVDYRRGLGLDDDGPYLTRADIEEIERQGYPCTVITIKYVENWRQDAQ